LNSPSGLRPVSDSISNGIKPEPANNDQKQGLSVSSQVTPIVVKKVDSGNADNLGDVAGASLRSSADNGGPRKPVNQFPLGRNQAPSAPAKSFPSDQGAQNS
jgi:hypothetical protein